jgi:hypothetical protein
MARLLCVLLCIIPMLVTPAWHAAAQDEPPADAPPAAAQEPTLETPFFLAEDRPTPTIRTPEPTPDAGTQWQALRAKLEAASQWRVFLDGYIPLVLLLYRVADYYTEGSQVPTRIQTPEFQAMAAEEAAVRAALSRLVPPLQPGRDDVRRDIDRMSAALDTLRTLASSSSGSGSAASSTERDRALRALYMYGEFSAAASASLDRLQALSGLK